MLRCIWKGVIIVGTYNAEIYCEFVDAWVNINVKYIVHTGIHCHGAIPTGAICAASENVQCDKCFSCKYIELLSKEVYRMDI